nr:uncharacterized protein LOC113712785 isoform X2 [Coffea arabica]
MASQIQANNLYHRRHFLVTLSNADYPFGTRTSLSISAAKPRTKPKLKPQKLSICSSLLSSSSSVSDKNPPDACEETNGADARTSDSQSIQKEKRMKKKRVFFLDVNALCYQGNTRSLHSFAHWIFLFFSQVSLSDPVIAVVDGERGNEYRKQILPSYKANRRRFSQHFSSLGRFPRNRIGRSHKLVLNVLHGCNVPVVKIEAHEADDVIATLVEQVISRGYQAVVASPDKDFRQLLSQDVQIVMPMPKCNRWSFYTLNHYIAQYTCDPQSDLSLSKFLIFFWFSCKCYSSIGSVLLELRYCLLQFDSRIMSYSGNKSRLYLSNSGKSKLYLLLFFFCADASWVMKLMVFLEFNILFQVLVERLL